MSTHLLSVVPHFRKLPASSLERLARDFTWRAVAAGETIYEFGDPAQELFVVESGTVLLLREADGRQTPDSRLRRGDVFGLRDLFDNERRTEAARAVTDGRIQLAAKENLLGVLADEPMVTLCLRLAAARGHTRRSRLALETAQRRAVRKRVQQEVVLSPAGANERVATLVDASHLGMYLKGVPADWCQEATVAYELAWGDSRLKLGGRVAWSEGGAAGIELENDSAEQRALLGDLIDRMLAATSAVP